MGPLGEKTHHPWRAFAVLVIVLSAIYFATAPKRSWSNDPFTNTVLAWSIGARGTVFLHDYSAFLQPEAPRGVASIVPGTKGPAGVVSPGVALHAAPLYAVFRQPLGTVVTVDTNQRPFAYQVPPIWPGALVAALTTAGTVGVLYLIFRRLGGGRPALLGALLFAFGTGAWSVSSQALWRHGPAMLWLALGLLLSQEPRLRSGLWWIPAILTRPQTGVIPFVYFAHRAQRSRDRRWLRPLIVSTAGLLPLVVYNRYVFGTWSPLGGFTPGEYARALDLDLVAWAKSVLLGLVDLRRGLLPISPFLVVLVPGLPCAWRKAPGWVRAAALGGVAHLLVQFYLQDSTGGDRFFGYRYPLETLVAAAPLLLLAYQCGISRSRFRGILFLTACLTAVGLQAIGVANPYSF